METIKEEKKADLEQLLNSLIEKGWKPRGYKNCIRLNTDGGYIPYMEDENRSIEIDKSIRDLTAKESGLWQFVCENGMIKHEVYEDIQSWEHTTAEHSDFWYTSGDNYEYRLIESALLDEDKLEDFILDNIKVDVESN